MWRPPEPATPAAPAASRRARRPRLRACSRPCASARSTSPSAPGFPRWCPGARRRTASSPPRVVAWYERLARGRPGAIVVEATGIRDVPSGPLLRIGHDRFLPGLGASSKRSRGRARAARGCSSRSSISSRSPPARPEEILRALPRDHGAHRAALGGATLAEDEVRKQLFALGEAELAARPQRARMESLSCGYRERVTDVDLPHIRISRGSLRRFSPTPRGAREAAGFDGVELHYAHAYTMASFLSAHEHARGRLRRRHEARLRLPLEVYAACAGAGRRTSSSAVATSQKNASRAATKSPTRVEIGKAFARAGMDFLSTSRGGKFDDARQPGVDGAVYPYTGPQRLRMHAAIHLRRAGAVRPQRRTDARHPRGDPRRRDSQRRSSAPAASIISRSPRRWLARGRVRHRRRRAPVARRSRLAAQDRARAAAARCAPASSPTIARAWTRSTSR